MFDNYHQIYHKKEPPDETRQFSFSIQNKKEREQNDYSLTWTGSVLFSQLPTIFAAVMLNFCVRHGYRCFHHAFTTRSLRARTLKTEQPLSSTSAKPSVYQYHSAQHVTMLAPMTYLPPRLGGTLLPKNGKSHLGGGFTLRCLQRLSLPDLATQLCSWRNNWCTSGRSIPVLSY